MTRITRAARARQRRRLLDELAPWGIIAAVLGIAYLLMLGAARLSQRTMLIISIVICLLMVANGVREYRQKRNLKCPNLK